MGATLALRCLLSLFFVPGRHARVLPGCVLLAACAVLPTAGADEAGALRHRALQTTVSDVAGLTGALADPSVGHILVASGHYLLGEELYVNRSVIVEAAVPGSVVFDAGYTAELSYGDRDESRRVLNVDPQASDVVHLIGLNITGGSVAGGQGNESNGGGILVSNGHVTMTNVAVYDNYASNVRGHAF